MTQHRRRSAGETFFCLVELVRFVEYSLGMPTGQSYEFVDEDFLRRLEQLHLIAKRVSQRGASGRRRSRRLGDGLEFADHRDYTPGDDVRFIDWAYFARMERLLLRLFHEHSEAGVAILLDISASMAVDREKFIYALRSAAALGYVAMGSLERVTLLPFSEEIHQPMQTGRNRRQIFQVLDYLASLRPGGRTELLKCVEEITIRRPRADIPGTVMLISDLLHCAEELSAALSLLVGRGCDVSVLHVYSPADASPPLGGPVLLRDLETNREMNVNVTDEFLDSYRLRWAEFVGACERTCLRVPAATYCDGAPLDRGATYIPAPTTVPFERLILRTLRQAGVLSG